MKNYLIIGIFACLSHQAIADTKLADKILIQVETTELIKTIIKPQQETIITPSEPTSNLAIKTTSPLEKVVNHVKYISEGAGILGDNLTTVINKDIVGLQYTSQW